MTRAQKILELFSGGGGFIPSKVQLQPRRRSLDMIYTQNIQGIVYKFLFSLDTDDSSSEKGDMMVAFDRGGMLAQRHAGGEKSTKGDMKEILQAMAILDAMFSWVFANLGSKIKRVVFSAGLDEPSRVKLYDRLVQRLAQKVRGKLSVIQKAMDREYRITL